MSGTRWYDILTPDKLAAHYRGNVQYCPEDDVHFLSLSVEQTSSFAAKTRAPRSRFDGHTRERYNPMMIDIILTIFGHRHARGTKMRDVWIREVRRGSELVRR